MDDFDKEIENDVNDIMAQLKNQTKSFKKIEKEYPHLEKKDIERFILDNASKVVTDCVQTISTLQDDVQACGDPKLIEAAATFVNAFTSAIDVLSKLHLTDTNNASKKELKQMDITSKAVIEDTKKSEGVYISREELIKGIIEHREVKEEKVEEEVLPPAIDV
jgi:hypothetical protein